MNKKQLSERDICTKFITPALLLFHGIPGLEAYFVVDTERTDGFIKFVSDGQKVSFAKDVVPTVDTACFEVFRPMFEFIKSKCLTGVAAGSARP